MHMWMWFGFDLGEFLFSGLFVSTRWAFALTWVILFITAVLFEGSKVYLARVQREAHKKLRPYRSDERRNLLCQREQSAAEPSTSRSVSASQVNSWDSFRVRTLVNSHQTLVFLAHNVVGYLLMLAVMLYNFQLMLAVVLGMMLGYFLFGTQLTRLQMQCFGSKRVVICTPECDDTAENSTPPLLNSSTALDSDIFSCQTRTCIQPSHYFRASTSQDSANTSCQFGAKSCPSKVARAKKLQTSSQRCHHSKTDKEDSPSVEDAQLLREERHSCCKKQELPPQENVAKCCNSSQINTTILVQENIEQGLADKEERQDALREDSPHITCCHNAKLTSESQEQIVNID